MVNLRGFTAAAQTRAPNEVVRQLNEFYERVTRAVVDRDGTLDKLLGDHVAAFFGVPFNQAEHERRAIEAALEVIASLTGFWGDEPLVGGAVGTGLAFVGNVGEGETRDYTAVGPVVSATTSASEHAAAGELVVLPETYAAVAGRYPDATVRTLTLGGGHGPIPTRVIALRPAVPAETGRRYLATILSQDLVASTEHAARIGDAAWRDLLARHYVALRELLAEYGGAEIDTAGDGLLATFQAPAQAIHFAHALCASDEELGLASRVGVHAGEVEPDGSAIRGIAVVIAARIAGLASGGQVLVSSTVRDLVAGSGIGFRERGVFSLKGVPEARQLFEALSLGD